MVFNGKTAQVFHKKRLKMRKLEIDAKKKEKSSEQLTKKTTTIAKEENEIIELG
jgi:hypothetical protein